MRRPVRSLVCYIGSRQTDNRVLGWHPAFGIIMALCGGCSEQEYFHSQQAVRRHFLNTAINVVTPHCESEKGRRILSCLLQSQPLHNLFQAFLTNFSSILPESTSLTVARNPSPYSGSKQHRLCRFPRPCDQILALALLSPHTVKRGSHVPIPCLRFTTQPRSTSVSRRQGSRARLHCLLRSH